MKRSHVFILLLSMAITLGYTWSLDMPLALQVPLRQDPYNFTNFEFSLLYFSTYIAIGFSDIPIGMLLDKLPIRKTVISIAIISLLSQISIFFMLHFRYQGYKTFIYISRGFFGMMGQGIYTVQAILISRYGGRHYDTLIGVGICLPLLFDSLNNIATPVIFEASKSMDILWIVGSGFCVFSLISAIVIAIFVSRQQKEQKDSESILQKIESQKQQKINFNGLKKLPKQFWIIVGAIFFTQYNIASYIDNLNDTIVKRFQIPYVHAGYLMFIPYGIAALISFFLGQMLEKKPKFRRLSLVFSTIMYSTGLIVMYLLPNISTSNQPPLLYYFVIVVQFSTIGFNLAILYTCLSSSIKYVVPTKHLGIAWGVIGSSIGFSQAIGPLIAAGILQSSNSLAQGYQNLTLSIFLTNFIAIGFSMWILYGPFESIDVSSFRKKPQSLNESSLLDSQELILQG